MHCVEISSESRSPKSPAYCSLFTTLTVMRTIVSCSTNFMIRVVTTVISDAVDARKISHHDIRRLADLAVSARFKGANVVRGIS